jgi:AAA domain, putative AbiEii toxin, Type IV TA system
MLLVKATITKFKSIEHSGDIVVDPRVTVLVGLNEAGKTATLQGLYKSRPLEGDPGFDPVEDYPRRDFIPYMKEHDEDPAEVCRLTYEMDDDEVAEINQAMGATVLTENRFTRTVRYNNYATVDIKADETAFLQAQAAATPDIGAKALAAVQAAPSVRKLLAALDGVSGLAAEGEKFKEELAARFAKAPASWNNVVAWEVWAKHVWPKAPLFLYFDDYHLLPGKVNLSSLQQRFAHAKSNPKALTDEDKTVLGLLRMAGVELEDLTDTSGYETVKAKLEGISNQVTDQVFKYWRQNQELDVEFDIRQDPTDEPPFNSGPNLYIRIKNRRHRVTVPFSQRSKGFIWFFSFLVWFDSVREQVGANSDIILLLDEPGLSLHALAQEDFLRYIDSLSERYQTLYTTHSPFMVHSDRLHQVRVVEDRKNEGTIITSHLGGSDPNTLFPLQAALGYTVAQNLFISKRNLLVEGPADLLYLQFFSAELERRGRTGLRQDVTIVPVGGLDKVATFVALLGANKLQLVVMHDLASKPDQRLEAIVRDKLLSSKKLLNYGQVRKPVSAATKKGVQGGVATATATATPPATLPPTDIEDLLDAAQYLSAFNSTFGPQLNTGSVVEADLPSGDRITDRLNRYLEQKGIMLRSIGGFNHYPVAQQFVTNPPQSLDADSVDRFEKLFALVNAQFTS